MNKRLIFLGLALAMGMVLAAPAAAAETGAGYQVVYQSDMNFTPWKSGGNIVAGYSLDDEGCRLLEYTGSGIEPVTPNRYRYAEIYQGKYAIVNYTQIVDAATGETIVPGNQYDSVEISDKQYAVGYKGGKGTGEAYLIDLKNGGSAVKLPAGSRGYSEGRILCVDSDGRYCYLNQDGKLVLRLNKGVRGGVFQNGYICLSVVKDSYEAGYYITDAKGRDTAYFPPPPRYIMGTVGPTTYHFKAQQTPYVSAEGLALIGKNEWSSREYVFGYCNVNGEIVIPCEYNRESRGFSYGYAVVGKGENEERQVGLINAKGQVVIPLGTYERLTDVSSTGLIWAKNKEGKVCVLKVPVTGFPDVPYSEYYGPAIKWGMETGVINEGSYTGDTFKPDKDSYILEALRYIWRTKGSPAPNIIPELYRESGNETFLIIQWAKENGLSWGSGTGDIVEGAQGITRAQMMLYLWKAAGSPPAGTAGGFIDVPGSAEYAQAVAWAVEKGITGGTGGNTFSPDQICTRGQVLTFIYRAMGKA